MKSRYASQRGFTLLELIAVLGISAIIMSGIAGLMYQEYRETNLAKTEVTAAQETWHATRWLSQDCMMAASTDLVEGTASAANVSLSWVAHTEFADIPHAVSYTLSGDELQRDYDGNVTTIAREISAIEFSRDNRNIIVSITCDPPWWNPTAQTKTTYYFYMRPNEEG